jgi:predicted nuclease of predicted toxin-antitoxin system
VRFLVDQCVPAEVTAVLRQRGHDVDLDLDDELDLGRCTDEHVLAYAAARRAAVVTTNADFVGVARRRQWASVVHLGREEHALEAVDRALSWLAQHPLPPGQVLRVSRRAAVAVMTPLRG